MKLNFRIFLTLIVISVNLAHALPKSNHGLDAYEWGKIDAIKNARLHSNMGNIYFDEKKYVSALKEYEVAFNLTADTNSSSTYLYNIAMCYIKMGMYKLAKNALIGAIERDCINMTYYSALVDCFIALGCEKTELNKHLGDYSTPYNRIIAGLIYLKTGYKMSAKAIFDEFVTQNPDMIITQDVKAILSSL